MEKLEEVEEEVEYERKQADDQAVRDRRRQADRRRMKTEAELLRLLPQ